MARVRIARARAVGGLRQHRSRAEHQRSDEFAGLRLHRHGRRAHDHLYASIQQVAPPTQEPYWSLSVRKGLFYTAYLPPGSYQLSKFGGSAFFTGEHVYGFPRQGNQTALRIEKPGIYFLGSYKYRDVKTGMFEQGKFSIDATNKPTEADLLRRILEEGSGIKDSAWRDRIQARLAKLKR
jgi:hypothetical protein